jgi:transposase
MESTEKDLRDQRIKNLNNEGKSIAEIAKEIGMSKGGVHKVLGKFLLKGDVAPKKENVVEVKISGTEERFDSFVGWTRLGVNEYVNEKTSEVIRVAYVKAKSDKEFGYFVKLGSVGKIEDIEVVSEEVKK